MPPTPSFEGKSLAELLAIVHARGSELDAFLATSDAAQPSFSGINPSPDFLPHDDPVIQSARAELVEAARTLADLVSSPMRALVGHCMLGHHDSFALQVLDAYDVPAHVPLTGCITYSDLAARCGLHVRLLRRIVRYAMASRFLAEPKPGCVAHSSTSALVAADPVTRHFFGHIMKNALPADACGLETLRVAADSMDPEHSAFAAANRGRSLWQVLKQDRARSAHFNGAMEFGGRATKMGAEPSPDWFGWATLPEGAVVVDCGGGLGHMSKSLAEQHAALSFVVQDLPEVIKQVDETQAMGGRIKFQPHSFFEPQPVKHADVYLFRRIFHDWPDKESTKIIRMLLPVMKAGSRIVVWDQVVPLPGTRAKSEEKLLRAQDIQMMLMMGAQERSLDEWQTLFNDASEERLRLESHTGMVLSFVLDA